MCGVAGRLDRRNSGRLKLDACLEQDLPITSCTFGPRNPWLMLMERVQAEKLLESSTLSQGTHPDLPGEVD